MVTGYINQFQVNYLYSALTMNLNYLRSASIDLKTLFRPLQLTYIARLKGVRN